jgi:hypothetical protein
VNQPPPLHRDARQKRKMRFYVIGVIVLFVALCGYFAFRFVVQSGITGGIDNKFGDQHLKTTVALLELHKIRFGRYPDSLGDLKFVGEWDQIALHSVRYYPSRDHASYYVEVQRGWIAKPNFVLPPEFWQGTGYSPSLKPVTQ